MVADNFIKNVHEVAKEKGIDENIIFDAMEQALITAYKKNYNSKTNVKPKIDRETGEIKIFTYYIVVEDYEDPEVTIDEEGNEIITEPSVPVDAQILLEDARKKVPDIDVGETIEEEVTPEDFGRVAVQTAKQVLIQKIRTAERESIMADFEGKEGELMLGMLAMEDERNYYVDFGRARGILPKSEMIPGEVVKMGSSIRVYLQKVEETTKGPLILCSRKHYNFVRRLFESEIPEFRDGTIVLHGVAREAGIRSKVSVESLDERIDARGACIGEKGVRIASILKELNGEKVDLILYSENPEEYIKEALSPAKNVYVSIMNENDGEKEAVVIVSDDELSLAIGKKGSNIRLASKLTKYHITIKSMSQVNEEGNKDEN
ncbi:MAG TPA: transcription termination/antitermination protein NusA [Firmicutes bacterium]|nr:transcription termination/antitermination protein NusA [Bacillota bacterium]